MQPRKLLFLAIAVVSFVLLVILILSIGSTPTTKTPLPITTVSPRPDFSNDIPGNTRGAFVITGQTIGNRKVDLKESFYLYFSQPVSYKDFQYSLNPPTSLETTLSPDRKTLTVSPTATWDADTQYQLTIKKEAKSEDGANLSSDYDLKFKTVPFRGI